jgi:hypothetical protein
MELHNFSKVVIEVNLTKKFIRGNLSSMICGLQNLRILVLKKTERIWRTVSRWAIGVQAFRDA